MIARILSISLAVLLFGLTFNAYACLVPLYYNAVQAPMDCSSASDQPAREYCDVFKTLGIEHANPHHSWLDSQTGSLGETISVTLPNTPVSTVLIRFRDSLAPPVDEVLAKLSVLRL